MNERSSVAPPRKVPGQRPVLQFRVHPHVYEELKRSAEERSLSISEEASRRLEEHLHHSAAMATAEADISRLREAVNTYARLIKTSEGAHQLTEKQLNKEIDVLKDEISELKRERDAIAIAYDAERPGQPGFSLSDYGYNSIALDDGNVVWCEPGYSVEHAATRLEAAVLAKSLAPIFNQALARAISACIDQAEEEAAKISEQIGQGGKDEG